MIPQRGVIAMSEVIRAGSTLRSANATHFMDIHVGGCEQPVKCPRESTAALTTMCDSFL